MNPYPGTSYTRNGWFTIFNKAPIMGEIYSSVDPEVFGGAQSSDNYSKVRHL